MNAAKFSPRIFTFRRSWNQLFYRRTPQLEFSIWCIYCKTASCCKPFFKSVSSFNLLNELSSVRFSCSMRPSPTALARQFEVAVWERLRECSESDWQCLGELGTVWEILEASGNVWKPPGSSWQLLAVPCSSWQLLAAPAKFCSS